MFAFNGGDMILCAGDMKIPQCETIKILELANSNKKQVQIVFTILDRDDDDILKLSDLKKGLTIKFSSEAGVVANKEIKDIDMNSVRRLTEYSIDCITFTQIVTFYANVESMKLETPITKTSSCAQG